MLLVQDSKAASYQMKDHELIRRYLDNSDQSAFRELLERYLSLSKRLVAGMCNVSHDHEDLVQQSWIKILNSLHAYKDEQKFEAFVVTIVKNTVRDYWRYTNTRKSTQFAADLIEGDQEFEFEDSSPSIEKCIDSSSSISKLLTEFIPQLPGNQRVVFLLKHESEYWEGKQRLDWQTLGTLTNQPSDNAWESFDRVRRIFKSWFDENTGDKQEVSEQELEVFAVWTQSQRPISHKKVTEPELASLLGIPVNTFRTRYRAAKQTLQKLLVETEAV